MPTSVHVRCLPFALQASPSQHVDRHVAWLNALDDELATRSRDHLRVGARKNGAHVLDEVAGHEEPLLRRGKSIEGGLIGLPQCDLRNVALRVLLQHRF